jgi:16S rRNA A1518/A1519 N6-dimethyltransferase RsmA/KsgA/DIM1 with predicted DNA glycosylase/AP lyase activity
VSAVVDLDVAFVQTPKSIVRQMLLLAGLRRGEILFDLGAGDGRILVEAAREFGARATGIEIDPERVSRIRERLKSTGIKAGIIQADFMDVDLSSADVVAIYLSESVNAKLAPKLERELKANARVVSLDYCLPGWVPEKELITKGALPRKLYLYRVSKVSTPSPGA